MVLAFNSAIIFKQCIGEAARFSSCVRALLHGFKFIEPGKVFGGFSLEKISHSVFGKHLELIISIAGPYQFGVRICWRPSRRYSANCLAAP